jgi:hypothetical protein
MRTGGRAAGRGHDLRAGRLRPPPL